MMLRRAVLAAGALLALFHIWLFAGQAWDGQLFELARISRWLVAAGLAAGLVRLRRNGASIFRGRKAVAVWLLAAVLHGPALARGLDSSGALPFDQLAATLVQAALVSAAICVLVLIAGRTTQPRAHRHPGPFALLSGGAVRRATGADAFLLAVPRPPPVA